MIEKNKIVLFGVAGAGKTTKCLEYIRTFLKEYNIMDIAFTTYTRAGIDSIRKKLQENQIYCPENSYFRTMHSITWRLSGFTREQMILPSELKKFFEQQKIPFKDRDDENEKTIGEYYLDFYEYYQNQNAKKISTATKAELQDALDQKYEDDDKITRNEIEMLLMIHELFVAWKDENNKKVHSDSLIEVLEKKIDIPVNVLIVDEAQDLYLLQQKIIEMWVTDFNKDYLLVAGDDDQTVHEWAGSKPDWLINQSTTVKEENKIILENTYRCPVKVCEVANEVLDHIKYRQPKKLVPVKKEKGELTCFQSYRYNEIIEQIKNDFYKLPKGKEMYILFRANKFRNEFAKGLFEQCNIPFSFLNKDGSSPYSLKFCCINNAIYHLVNRQDLSFQEAKYLTLSLPAPKLVKGMKTKFRKGKDLPKVITADWYLNNVCPLGLTSFEDKFDLKQHLLKNLEYAYVGKKNAEENSKKNDFIKQKLFSFNQLIEFKGFDDPDDEKSEVKIILPLQLGTFHASKGLQANTVFVFLNTRWFWNDINDSELRCLYVAVSRSEANLRVGYFTGFETPSDPSLLEFWNRLESVTL